MFRSGGQKGEEEAGLGVGSGQNFLACLEVLRGQLAWGTQGERHQLGNLHNLSECHIPGQEGRKEVTVTEGGKLDYSEARGPRPLSSWTCFSGSWGEERVAVQKSPIIESQPSDSKLPPSELIRTFLSFAPLSSPPLQEGMAPASW